MTLLHQSILLLSFWKILHTKYQALEVKYFQSESDLNSMFYDRYYRRKTETKAQTDVLRGCPESKEKSLTLS